jgi:hypothetical protein
MKEGTHNCWVLLKINVKKETKRAKEKWIVLYLKSMFSKCKRKREKKAHLAHLRDTSFDLGKLRLKVFDEHGVLTEIEKEYCD